MTDRIGLLTALQHGDSFFPGGSVAFSWGLETLRADGLIRSPEDVRRFVLGQVRLRWATLDRPILMAAHRTADDLARVAEIDRFMDAVSLAREFREGSRRAGAALLGVHEKIGTAQAAAYRGRVRDGEAPGHLAAMQGLVWRGAGLSEAAAAAVSAHALAVGLFGAALRLGLIGHIDCQRGLALLRKVIDGLMDEPPPSWDEIYAYTPETDIAAMRHETESVRLFAN